MVVVGGGVIGASVAWHLAARGCSDVLVLERGRHPGAGSTGRATGGFRAQFTTEVNVRLSLLAREKLLRFQDETCIDPGYVPAGYLFLASGEEGLAAFRRALAVQQSAGLVEAREVESDEIGLLNPALRLDGIVGGVFCPTDGFVRPLQILRGYLEAAQRRGVRFRLGAQVVAIRIEKKGERTRVIGVRTQDGEVATSKVVNAAGAWAGVIAAQAGTSLPVRPERRQVAVTHPFDVLPAAMPMTIFEDGFHLRVRDGRVLLLWPRETPGADPFDTRFDPAWLEGLLELASSRVPCLASAKIDLEACQAGLYEMTPDRHAIVGESPEIEGFYYANGSSGHGVMHSPALGQILAEILLDGEASCIDARPLRPTRFSEGEPNEEIGLL